MGATIADLEKVEGKAEIINGKIVHMSPTGGFRGRAATRISARLVMHEDYRGAVSRSAIMSVLLSIYRTVARSVPMLHGILARLVLTR